MVKGEKSFRDEDGTRIEREEAVSTKTGIIMYKGKGDRWIIDYPDMKQYGGVRTINLMNLIYHLGHGKKLDQARDMADLLTKDDLT